MFGLLAGELVCVGFSGVIGAVVFVVVLPVFVVVMFCFDVVFVGGCCYWCGLSLFGLSVAGADFVWFCGVVMLLGRGCLNVFYIICCICVICVVAGMCFICHALCFVYVMCVGLFSGV